MKTTDETRHSVTQREIARRCGIHQTTVSMVLRGDARVAADTAERVLAVAEELGYDAGAQDIARRLVMRRHGGRSINHLIALFFPARVIHQTYFNRILHGIADVLAEENIGLLTNFINPFGDDSDLHLPPCFRREQVDALIILQPPIATRRFEAELRQWPGFDDRPIITLVWEVDGCAFVGTDNTLGAYLACRHLLEQGHRHILQFRPTMIETYEIRFIWDQRLAGLRRAFAEFGLDADRQLHFFDNPPAWPDPDVLLPLLINRGQHAAPDDDPLLAVLRAQPEITGILGWNDAAAIRSCLSLEAAGFRVPEDYSVIGFDDTDALPDAQGRNCLTTIALPLELLGRAAAQLALDQVHNRGEFSSRLVLPTALMMRGTTGRVK